MKYLILFLLTLFSLSNSQDIEELLKPKCDGNKIEYSIYANLREYLDNENNIDQRKIYTSLEDLKDKRVGYLSGTYLGDLKFDNIKEFNGINDLDYKIVGGQIDVGIYIDEIAFSVQMLANEISIFPQPLLTVDCGFGLQKENTNLQAELNEFIKKNPSLLESLKANWELILMDANTIDITLDGTKGTLNIIAKKQSNPYSYVRASDNEIVGAEVEFIYKFAKEYGYTINIVKADSYEEQVNALKDKTADIALGFFVIKDNNDISFSDKLYTGTINAVVRYGNLPESEKWSTLYGSIEEFNGEKIGLLTGSLYESLTKATFPDSNIVKEDNVINMFKLLLLEDIEGFISDEPVVQYFHIAFPWRITYYTFDNVDPIQNAFAFQKNNEGENLLKEFNEFISDLNLDKIYKKWNVADTSKLTVDRDLNPKGKEIKVGFSIDTRPTSYYEGNDLKGVEIDILYQFAQKKGYYINFMEITTEQKASYITEGKADIVGGSFSITEERKKLMNFSNPLYKAKVVLAVRVDSKKDMIPLVAVNRNFTFDLNTMYDVHNVDIQVKFKDDNIKTSSCILPGFYNDTILINCTISDLKDVNVSNGFEYYSSRDSFYLLYNGLSIHNFLLANTKITGHPNIIKMDTQREIICTSNSPLSAIIALIGGISIAALILLVLSKCIETKP